MSASTAKANVEQLREKLRTIRKGIITSTTAAGSGHPTSSLSAAEMTTALFFAGFLRFDPKNPSWPQRDRFILSKGHAAPLLYAVMAEAGYFPASELNTLRKLGSPLEGHPNLRRLPGIEASTGSLGQGLSLGVGHALAVKLDRFDSNVFVLLGDGEVGEGQVWEAVMSAAKYKLDNLIAIVDQNGYQQTGATKEVLDLTPLAPKFEAFGWVSQEIEGNSLENCIAALQKAVQAKGSGKPQVIISKTVKGYPISHLLGNDPNHHGKPLTAEQATKVLEFLETTTA